MTMRKLPVVCAVLCLMLSISITAVGESVFVDPCDSTEGKTYAAYGNFLPAQPAMPFASQAVGASDSTSLKMVDPSRPATAVYQVDSPEGVEILLYSGRGTFSTLQPDLNLYQLGSSATTVNPLQTLSCVVNGEGEIFLQGRAMKLYHNNMMGMAFFYESAGQPGSGLSRLGLNLEASRDGTSYTAVEPVLSQVEVYTKNGFSLCYGERYTASLPSGTVVLRVTLRDVGAIPVKDSMGEQTGVRLELAEVRLWGGGFVQSVTPPPSSSQPESSSSLPAPDISGSDSAAQEDEGEEDEEEKEDGEDWEADLPLDGNSSNRGGGGGFAVAGGTTRVVTASPSLQTEEETAAIALSPEEGEEVVTVFRQEEVEASPFAQVERGVLLWIAVASAAVFLLVYWVLKR